MTGWVVVLVPASPVGGGVGSVVAGRVATGAVVATTMGSGSVVVVGSGAGGSNPGGGAAATGTLCSCGSRSMNVGPGMVRLGTDGRVVDVVGLGVELVVAICGSTVVVAATGAGAAVVVGAAVVAGVGATVVAGSVEVLTVVVDDGVVDDGVVVDGSVPATVVVDAGAGAAVVVGDTVVVGAMVVAATVDVLATTVEVVDVDVDVEVDVDVVVVAPMSALNRRMSACGAPMMASASDPNQPDRIDEYTRRKSSVGRRLPLLSSVVSGGASPYTPPRTPLPTTNMQLDVP